MARPSTAATRLLTGEREPVRLATTGNITLSGLQTIDGVLTIAGDRILVKDQSTPASNGIYTASAGTWFRASDARTSRALQKNTSVAVQFGATNSSTMFFVNTAVALVGSDPIQFNKALPIDPSVLVIDEDDMASNSDTKLPTQQSVKTFAEENLQFSQALTNDFWAADDARIHRMGDRLLIDAAARDFAGESDESASYVASVGGSGYVDRAASFASYSSVGGVGGAFGSRASDQYTTFPNRHPGVVPVAWIASAGATLNSRVAYQGRVYRVTTAGALGSSPPGHTTGSAANGTATLLFIDYTYMSPIGISAFGIQDHADTGTGVWAMYGETVTTESGRFSSSYLGEFNVKNKSSYNPINGPYNRFEACMGIGMAAGGDSATGGAATNPSSSAILIYKNSHTWNTGIVFDAEGITGTNGVTGYGIAMKFARGHVLQWQYNNGGTGAIGFEFVSTVDSSAGRQTVAIDNTSGILVLNDNSIANFRIGRQAGTVTGNFAVTGSQTAFPTLLTEGSATNIDAGYITKGTGTHQFSTGGTSTNKQVQIGHVANAVNYIQLTGAATGQTVSIAPLGTDANISMQLIAKGLSSVFLGSNGTLGATVSGVASGVNWVSIVGSATGSNPIISATGSDTNRSIIVRGRGNAGVRIEDGGSAAKIEVNTTGIGFNGTAPVAKPSITGSRGGNAALADLLTKLAATGILTDGTSA